MKARIIYLFLFLCLGFFVFNSHSSGAGAVQNTDRTGSPLSPGACNVCHSGGDFGTSINAFLLKDDQQVTSYTPGETYQLRVLVGASGSPAGFGFQAVLLTGDDNLNAGTMGSAPNGTQVTDIEGRNYFEHSQRLTSGEQTIEWTAPEAGTGDVRIYAVGNAVNGGGTSGDQVNFLSNPVVVTENITSSVFNIDRLNVNLGLYPNPTTEWLTLNVDGADAGDYMMSIVDLNGRTVLNQLLEINVKEFVKTFSVSTLEEGYYFLRLADGEAVASVKFLKR